MKKKLLTTLKWQLKEHPLIALGLLLTVCALCFIYGGAFIDGARNAKSQRAVSQTQGAAQTEQSEAGRALTHANQEAIDRQVEDGLRRRVIQPEAERTRRAATATRERTRMAQAAYEDVQKHPPRGDADSRRLHERNCADLAELYPGESIADCN